jgi:subtilisin family serine protease
MAEQAAPAKEALRAPGRDILTLVPEGHYDFATGSSLAAANVSGIVALMRARRPQMTAADAKALLGRSTQEVAGATHIVESINACAALSALLMTGHCAANARGSADTATASVARDAESSR